jgi:hypothetical protein
MLYSSSVLSVVGVTSVIIIKGHQLLISGEEGPQYVDIFFEEMAK